MSCCKTPRFLHCGWSGQAPRAAVMSLVRRSLAVWSEPGWVPAGLCLRTPVSEGQPCLGGRSVLASHRPLHFAFLSFIHVFVSSGTPLVPVLKNKSIKLVSNSLQTMKWLLKTRPRRERGGLKVLVLGSESWPAWQPRSLASSVIAAGALTCFAPCFSLCLRRGNDSA